MDIKYKITETLSKEIDSMIGKVCSVEDYSEATSIKVLKDAAIVITVFKPKYGVDTDGLTNMISKEILPVFAGSDSPNTSIVKSTIDEYVGSLNTRNLV